MYIFEYLVIVLYLFCFTLKCPLLIGNSIIKKLSNFKIVKFFSRIGLFMNWNMFCKSPSTHNKIKFIIELKNGEILIYYLDTKKINNCISEIIPELDLKPKSLASLIHNYYHHGFLIVDYIEQIIKDKYGEDLKCFSSYLQILTPNKTNPLKMHIGTYYPIIEKSYVDN